MKTTEQINQHPGKFTMYTEILLCTDLSFEPCLAWSQMGIF